MGLKGKSCLRLMDFSLLELETLLDLALVLKKNKKAGTEQRRLEGKNIALIFEKTSTRTRCAFEVAAFDQGAKTSYLEKDAVQMGTKESIRDTARILGRFYDGIEYRGYSQETAEELAHYAGVPVWNGLTDEFHPTQVLADFLTIRETFLGKKFSEIQLVYIGDGRNNMANSLLEGAAMMGMNFKIISPKEYWPSTSLIAKCQILAQKTGAKIELTDKVEKVKGADFIYTDVWVSMGEPEAIWYDRIKKLRPYQVNRNLLELTGNKDVKFLHCLPAYHDNKTEIGRFLLKESDLDGLEVTDEVFESPASLVFDQAENRLHTIKALMVATLS